MVTVKDDICLFSRPTHARSVCSKCCCPSLVCFLACSSAPSMASHWFLAIRVYQRTTMKVPSESQATPAFLSLSIFLRRFWVSSSSESGVRTDRRLRMSYRPPLEPSPCVLNQSPCRSKTHRHASTMVVSGVFDGGDVRLPTTTVADAVSILE
jgi:hypothetical protein